MIDVELSNIWGSVSLPDLLSGEKDLFDAHMQLRTNTPDGPDFLGWLNAPEGVMARSILAIGTAAGQIGSRRLPRRPRSPRWAAAKSRS